MTVQLALLVLGWLALFPGCLGDPVDLPKVPGNDWDMRWQNPDYMMGATIAVGRRLQDEGGVQFRNILGEVQDVFGIFSDLGFNWAVLPLYVNATCVTGEHCDSIDETLSSAQAAIALGMKVNLQLVFSDTETFGTTQGIPSEWSGYSATELVDVVGNYTKNVLEYFESNSALPRMITMGRRSEEGILLPAGASRANYIAYLESVSAAIRSFYGEWEHKIMIHYDITSDGGYYFTQDFIDANVDFDVFGVRYFPAEDGQITKVNDLMLALRTAWPTKKMIFEVGYPASSVQLSGDGEEIYPFTPAGRKEWISYFEDFVARWPETLGWYYAEGDAVVSAAADISSSPYSLFLDDGSLNFLEYADSLVFFDKIDYHVGLPYPYGFYAPISKPDFIMGGYLQTLRRLQDVGNVKFQNLEGKVEDGFKVFGDMGFNYAFLPLYVNGACFWWRRPRGRGCDTLEETLEAAQRSKAQGMRVGLQLIFADSITESGMNPTPAVWANYTADELNVVIPLYIEGVLTFFEAGGALPDMVSIGRNINYGILQPQSEETDSAGESMAIVYLKTACLAIRNYYNGRPHKIMLHTGFELADQVALHLMYQQKYIDYDVAGIFYAPTVQGTLNYLRDQLGVLGYSREIVFETGYIGREEFAASYYPGVNTAKPFPFTGLGRWKYMKQFSDFVCRYTLVLGWYYYEPDTVRNSDVHITPGAFVLFYDDGSMVPMNEVYNEIKKFHSA
eukprot:Filipodium_phascolosomae@DN2536_c0_g1_i10.p1